MNDIKRMFSCFSVLAVCLLANMGVQAKAVTTAPITNIMQNKQLTASNSQAQTLFTLSNTATINSNNEKLADHYSHVSHRSHQSHYSSRY